MSVDLESRLLVNKGLEITTKEGIGRLVVATKSFNVLYEVAIRETPLLVWRLLIIPGKREIDYYTDFLERFHDADTVTQNAILDMYHVPLSTMGTLEAQLKTRALDLSASESFPYDDPSFIHKLLAIVWTNSTGYDDQPRKYHGGNLKQCEVPREQLGMRFTAPRSPIPVNQR